MPDVQHLNLFLFLQHAVYCAIDVRPVAVEQMPELIILRRGRASVGLFFQTENRCFKSVIPLQRRFGMFGVDRPVQVS